MEARRKLIESFAEAGRKAFDPNVPESSRVQAVRDFDDLVARTKTLNALGALNSLIKPGAAPPWLRQRLIEKLTRLPMERSDGVRTTLEFVFSVHPTSTVRLSEAAVPQKRGANITQDALNLACNLLSTPASVPPEEWYAAVAPQLLALLDKGDDEPELVKAASYIIGFGILGKRATGAPGTAGWKYFAEPMLFRIKPPPGVPRATGTEDSEIIDLSKDKVVVSCTDLSTALRRLHALVVAHPNPGLCKRLLSPLLLSLWTLATWDKTVQQTVVERVCEPALALLKIFLKLTPSPDLISLLVQNMGYVGGYNSSSPEWMYKAINDSEIVIVDTEQPIRSASASSPRLTLEDIDRKVPKLLDLVTLTLSDADVSIAFLELFNSWLKSARRSKEPSIMIKQDQEQEDPISRLVEMRTLQAMMEKFPEKLATQPKHILNLVSQILSNSGEKAEDEDEVISVALSLLNMIVTTPGFQKSRVNPETLALIESSLDTLAKSPADFSQTASNLRLLLLYRDEVDPAESTSAAPTDRQVEDRKTYSLAISYITAPDSPPPVRSEGVNLLSTLITSRSPVLDIPGILVLLGGLLADEDEYIYLRVIKAYTLLCDAHPRSVVRELTDRFVDARETQALDARLRAGEALLQVVQRLGETFTGDLARETATALVTVAGRRPRRPRTEARRQREKAARERREREARDAWGGEVPDFSDPDDEDEDDDDRRRKEVIGRIVQGWEGKRGSEDMRVRASALSVLGAAVEVNVAGLGRELVSGAVDLCVAVLQLEREEEKGILRRAAVMFVLSFVRALEDAREKGRDLGFGFGARAQEDVMRTLRYVAETDNDGLVVQHARDVVESLENWQVVRLMPSRTAAAPAFGGGLTRLAGLEVNPERSAPAAGSGGPGPAKPRIEEVE
ncbi:uncharacterized protein P884DRAFT_238134 [Thermothelomyces heterothallicus CBS 202.75]|uniref:uncharacterized protein n=1 Tax=Thermothelomyces heterothallicus CBS 202.75 TaxID=1149848 RepID=UPI003744A384